MPLRWRAPRSGRGRDAAERLSQRGGARDQAAARPSRGPGWRVNARPEPIALASARHRSRGRPRRALAASPARVALARGASRSARAARPGARARAHAPRARARASQAHARSAAQRRTSSRARRAGAPRAARLRTADRRQADRRDAGAGRFQTDAKLARHAGVAPLPASSRARHRHRVDRRGNRQLNCAFHRIAVTQARIDPEARAFLERKRSEGKSTREALRSLKRRLVRRVHRLLAPPRRRPSRPISSSATRASSAPAVMSCLT